MMFDEFEDVIVMDQVICPACENKNWMKIRVEADLLNSVCMECRTWMAIYAINQEQFEKNIDWIMDNQI